MYVFVCMCVCVCMFKLIQRIQGDFSNYLTRIYFIEIHSTYSRYNKQREKINPSLE